MEGEERFGNEEKDEKLDEVDSPFRLQRGKAGTWHHSEMEEEFVEIGRMKQERW